jgi:demethylmenaquinone methyltransferase / 2-methoxy-6-polyprenyl-1,4-benzoquinol methylase
MTKLSEQKQNSWKIFDKISKKYDLINQILSFGCDKRWRKKLNLYLPPKNNLSLLDVATGSADQILALLKSNQINKAIGIDLSKEMLFIAKKKLKKNSNVSFELASAENIPYQDNSFDVVSCSFGIRNVFDVEKSLAEMHRVLKKDGHLLILEFSLPQNKIIKFFHLFYLRYVLPMIGGIISKNFKAYSYLNETIESFPYGLEFCKIIKKNNFQSVKAIPLNFGALTLYIGIK